MPGYGDTAPYGDLPYKGELGESQEYTDVLADLLPCGVAWTRNVGDNFTYES